MSKLLGFILIIAGIYFLGQNIIFATTFFPYRYPSLPALGSVLSIIAGVITLVFFPRVSGNLGWIFLGIAIVLVFLSGGVILRPTSLWNFLVYFTALAVGYKLINERRFRF
ncbi:MAG TPA: hypothetical protein DEV81_23080 [Cyanobacteria bacterium UBA11049]|nr:hypothetical protein [Cyanobacteria bacterium UBA11049]